MKTSDKFGYSGVILIIGSTVALAWQLGGDAVYLAIAVVFLAGVACITIASES